MTQPDPPPVPAGDAASEPALVRGALTALGTAVLALVATLGVPMSAGTREAVLAVLAAAAPLVAGWLIRRKVFSPATVQRILAAARVGQGR